MQKGTRGGLLINKCEKKHSPGELNSQEGALEVAAVVHPLSTCPVDLRWLLAVLRAFPRLLCVFVFVCWLAFFEGAQGEYLNPGPHAC